MYPNHQHTNNAIYCVNMKYVTSDGHWGIGKEQAGQEPHPTTFKSCDLRSHLYNGERKRSNVSSLYASCKHFTIERNSSALY